MCILLCARTYVAPQSHIEPKQYNALNHFDHLLTISIKQKSKSPDLLKVCTSAFVNRL